MTGKTTAKVALLPGETMRQYKARVNRQVREQERTKAREQRTRDQEKRFNAEAGLIVSAIQGSPGIKSIAAIADVTGLPVGRTDRLVKAIKGRDSAFKLIDYGEVHGERGWFSMNRKAHHQILDQADEHGAKTELGIRRGRLIRLARAEGELTTAEAGQAVANMERRLGLEIKALSTTDLEAFEELLMDAVRV